MAAKFFWFAALVALGTCAVVEKETPFDYFQGATSEDEFEDRLDAWLAWKEAESAESSRSANARELERFSGCTFRVNGDLGQPQPVYMRNGDYMVPTRNTGYIQVPLGEEISIACTGSGRTIAHPNAISSVAFANVTCVRDSMIVSEGFLSGPSELLQLTCSSHAYHDALRTGNVCYNGKTEIKVGFEVLDEFYPKFYSCFDEDRLEVLYTWYQQNEQNGVHQSGVARPSWLVSSYFPGIGINNRYTQANQLLLLNDLVGEELAAKYLTSTQFLARGHLVAKTDMIYATGQRSTFYFINAAPQWQPFNAGNWNWLEQNLRGRIGVRGSYTTIWTGTWGVSQMRNQTGHLVDYYLLPDENNNNRIPVPLYFWKVVFDSDTQEGTAFVSINNPYYTEEEVRAMTFCEDRCKDNADFSWIGWQPERIEVGWSFCCTVEEFRQTVPYLPQFNTTGLLY